MAACRKAPNTRDAAVLFATIRARYGRGRRVLAFRTRRTGAISCLFATDFGRRVAIDRRNAYRFWFIETISGHSSFSVASSWMVIASGAKQSSDRVLSQEFTTSGLLRSARNDGVITQREFVKIAFPSFFGPKPLISHNRPKEMFGKSLENIWRGRSPRR